MKKNNKLITSNERKSTGIQRGLTVRYVVYDVIELCIEIMLRL